MAPLGFQNEERNDSVFLINVNYFILGLMSHKLWRKIGSNIGQGWVTPGYDFRETYVSLETVQPELQNIFPNPFRISQIVQKVLEVKARFCLKFNFKI